MAKVLLIARREMFAYLGSPVTYIIACVFTIITGYFFGTGISVPFPEATVSQYVGAITLVLVFVAPALTMRLLAEERRLGTLDLLMSAPVSDWQVTIGKYLGALVPFVLMLLLTLFYAGLMYWHGTPDTGVVATSYLGLLLYGVAALAVGLWASSLAANQALAAVVGMGVLLLLSVTQLAGSNTSGWLATALDEASMVTHFSNMQRGVIDTFDIVYYLSIAATFLFLCVRTLEVRRWL